MSITKFYVYVYYDPTKNNAPFYVGKGSGNRMYKHLRETYENTENKKKWAIIKGIRNKNKEPIVEIYKDVLTDKKARELEKYLIKKWGRRDIDENGILTNICVDSHPPTKRGKNHPHYGKPLSEETKKKISKSKKENPFHPTDEQKQNRYYPHGKDHPWYGKTHTAETKAKFKTRKLGSGMTGKTHTSETKKKLSEAFNNGKKSERIEKIRQSVLAKQGVLYRVIDPDGNEYTATGMPQFAVEHNLSISSIRAMIHRRKNGHDTKHKGWIIEKLLFVR